MLPTWNAVARSCALALFVLPLAAAPDAGAQEPAPFRIHPESIATLAAPPGDYHLGRPLFTPPGSESDCLALQAAVWGGFGGFIVAMDLEGQLAAQGDTRARTLNTVLRPKVNWRSADASRARLWYGTWFIDAGGKPAFLYDSNGNNPGDQAGPFGYSRSIWMDDARICSRTGTDITFPSSVPGSDLVLCQVGKWGDMADIGCFTLDDPTVKSLTSSQEISETSAAQCPGSEVVAFLESRERNGNSALNTMLLKREKEGGISGQKQFPDGGAASLRQLGPVDAFSWCPRTFTDEGRGTYGLLAYYAEVPQRDDPSKVRRDLYVVPVTMTGKIIASSRQLIFQNVQVETELLPTPPAWYPSGEYIFFVESIPGQNPLRVARIPPDSHFRSDHPPIDSWPLRIWEEKDAPYNIAVACSGDGKYLGIVAKGRSAKSDQIYYENAYVVPLERP